MTCKYSPKVVEFKQIKTLTEQPAIGHFYSIN